MFLQYLLSSLCRVDSLQVYVYFSCTYSGLSERVDGLQVYVYFSCTYSGLCEGLMASSYMYISPVLTQVSVKG